METDEISVILLPTNSIDLMDKRWTERGTGWLKEQCAARSQTKDRQKHSRKGW